MWLVIILEDGALSFNLYDMSSLFFFQKQLTDDVLANPRTPLLFCTFYPFPTVFYSWNNSKMNLKKYFIEFLLIFALLPSNIFEVFLEY